jgi:predicted  nucleic acid-binding Zn-ribbon protein
MEPKDHLVPITDQNTKQIIDALADDGVPVAELNRKFSRYQVKKAIQKLKIISREVSASYKKTVESFEQSMEEAFADIDKEMQIMNDQLQAAEEGLNKDMSIVEKFFKKHEGKHKQHIRLSKGIKVTRCSDNSTVLQVAEPDK